MSAHRVAIRPPRRWPGVDLGELWGYRELLYFLTKRELQIRYKQSLLGVSWALLQPLALTVMFGLFLGRLKVASDDVPYPVFALAGLTPWIYISQATAQSATSLVADANLISKVYFPRLVIPIARVSALLVDLSVATVALFVAALLYGVDLAPRALVIVPFLFMAIVVAASLGTLLAALNVRYRDVSLIVPFGVQIWLFASPVAYSSALVHGDLRYLYAVNPVVGVIDGVRWSLLGTTAPALGELAVSVGAMLVLAFVAVTYFRRSESSFADIV